ncbi:hypothetical protein UlMin_025075, partial [Ulmus minor]
NLRRTQAYGFWISTTMNPCYPCSKGQMPSSMLWDGTALVQNCGKMIWMFMDYLK